VWEAYRFCTNPAGDSTRGQMVYAKYSVDPDHQSWNDNERQYKKYSDPFWLSTDLNKPGPPW